MCCRLPISAALAAAVFLSACSDSGDVTDDAGIEDITGESVDDADAGEQETEDDRDDEDVVDDGGEPADAGSDDSDDVSAESAPGEFDTDDVDTVVNELFEIETDVTVAARDQMSAGDMIPGDLLDRLRSITTADEFSFLAARVQSYADADFEELREDLGSPRFETERIIEQSDTCIVAGGTLDISASAPPDVEEPRLPYFTILAADDDEQANEGNPTSWLLAGGGATDAPEPTDYEEQCP